MTFILRVNYSPTNLTAELALAAYPSSLLPTRHLPFSLILISLLVPRRLLLTDSARRRFPSPCLRISPLLGLNILSFSVVLNPRQPSSPQAQSRRLFVCPDRASVSWFPFRYRTGRPLQSSPRRCPRLPRIFFPEFYAHFVLGLFSGWERNRVRRRKTLVLSHMSNQ